MQKGKLYPVKKLAAMAGITVKTLHLYDKTGLLKPAARTAAGYRLYGEKELLRLQQILLYRELDFPLKEIAALLDDPGFDLLKALENHRKALQAKRERFSLLLKTIDKTISQLKNGTMLAHEDLYEGLPKETATARRKEAIEKYGEEAVNRSENALRQYGKEKFKQLGQEHYNITSQLFLLRREDPAGEEVQQLIGKHYEITRIFWGTANSADPQAEAYAGLGELYVNDERFTLREGKPQPEFAEFLCRAMRFFSDTKL